MGCEKAFSFYPSEHDKSTIAAATHMDKPAFFPQCIPFSSLLTSVPAVVIEEKSPFVWSFFFRARRVRPGRIRTFVFGRERKGLVTGI